MTAEAKPRGSVTEGIRGVVDNFDVLEAVTLEQHRRRDTPTVHFVALRDS